MPHFFDWARQLFEPTSLTFICQIALGVVLGKFLFDFLMFLLEEAGCFVAIVVLIALAVWGGIELFHWGRAKYDLGGHPLSQLFVLVAGS